jgi:hypothetical protein
MTGHGGKENLMQNVFRNRSWANPKVALVNHRRSSIWRGPSRTCLIYSHPFVQFCNQYPI